MSVQRLKNFQGHWFNCSCCGRRIKHPFRVIGSDAIYGEHCALNAGFNPSKVLKQVKESKELVKQLNNIPDTNMTIYMEYLKMSKDEVLDYFYKKGKISL